MSVEHAESEISSPEPDLATGRDEIIYLGIIAVILTVTTYLDWLY